MTEVLVIANQTLAGRKLLDEVRARAAQGDVHFRLVVPMTKPSAGLVIYDDAVRDATQVRVDLALSVLAAEGIVASGEVGDPDPYSAVHDAIGAHGRPDEIIISTKPAESSGWLRRDLIDRVAQGTGVPVSHIVTDLEQETLPFNVTLVVANRTSSGEELVERLTAKAANDRDHLFIGVVPQQSGHGSASQHARERLAAMLDRLQGAGLLASGMIGDPDPYTATVNALELFRVNDIVISTLPDERSGWLRSNLLERVRRATDVPVEHVVVTSEAAEATTTAGN
jgi:hypothetical protein